ncbi:MAG TPA: hypothetical protein VLR94_09150 [Acidobacteriota bacterium]|nr:hypothetical protein [Acidobacteriota bacterium]
MRWGYPLFLLMLCGFGVVYLVWPVDQALAPYGMVVVNAALILAALSFTQSALLRRADGWQHSAVQGFTVGLWMWVAAGLLDALDLFLKTTAFESMADFLWATGYLPMFAGLYAGVKESWSPPGRQIRVVLLILAVGYVAAFAWYLLPHLMDVSRSLFSRAIDFTYISFNFLLLGALTVISRRQAALNGPLSAAVHLLAAATLLMIGADALLRITRPESLLFQLLDIPYFLIYALLFQAGQEFVRAKRRELAQ